MSAADALLRKNGVDKFTMDELARAAKLAKGTLYLYFQTKEELLLALYHQLLKRWRDRLAGSLKPQMSDHEFCQMFMEVSNEDSLMTALATRLTNLIELNVSMESLIESKRAMSGIVSELSLAIEQSIDLKEGQGYPLISSLISSLIGASFMEPPPTLDLAQLPDDVREIVKFSNGNAVFMMSAQLLLQGIRNS